MKFGNLRKLELEINHFFRQFDYFDEFCSNLGHFSVIFVAQFLGQNVQNCDQNTANWLRDQPDLRSRRFAQIWEIFAPGALY